MIILKILIFGIVISLTSIGIVFLAGEIERKMDIDDDDVTLTFDEFYQMYCIDPSKWELLYFAGNYFARYDFTRYEVNFPRYESIYFKRTRDYYRFKRFVLNEESRQNTEEANRKKLEILKSFQNDIDEYKKKYCGGTKNEI